LLHVGYSVALVKAYAAGDFGQVYPSARGSAPMLVTLGAVVLAGEVPPWPALAGIVLVSGGILSLARAKVSQAAPLSLAAALVTGLFIASYTLADGLGSRRAGDAVAFAFWLFVLGAPVLWLAFRVIRGRWLPPALDGNTWRAAIGGIVGLVAYAIVIWAASISPMGPVSALRETSVVIAALIARVAFGGRLTARRLGACVVIALGAMLIGLR
jgi:drug/metabolite transporter (DMT)-like permease